MVKLEEYLCPLSECQISLIKKILDSRLSHTELCEVISFLDELRDYTERKYELYSDEFQKGGYLK